MNDAKIMHGLFNFIQSTELLCTRQRFLSECLVFRVVICILFVVHLNVNGSGSITSVGEERANLSAFVYL